MAFQLKVHCHRYGGSRTAEGFCRQAIMIAKPGKKSSQSGTLIGLHPSNGQKGHGMYVGLLSALMVIGSRRVEELDLRFAMPTPARNSYKEKEAPIPTGRLRGVPMGAG